MYGFARPAGGRRRFAGPLCIALGALVAAGAPAAAQLPDLSGPVSVPLDDAALQEVVPGDAVEDAARDVVSQPLPEPAEQVVKDSPVAPIRDEVRRVVKETTGTVGGVVGGGLGGGGGSGGGTTGTGSSTGGSTGASSGGSSGGSRDSTGPRSGGGRRGRRGSGRAGSRRGADRRGDARAGGRAPRGAEASERGSRPKAGKRRRADAGDDRPNAAVRTIETIVHTVPTPIWIALAVLSLLALALGARTLVERRRARALARDREQLIHDVEVLERALLPAVPERVGAVATSVAYRPCNGPAAGGDFYDAFELPDGRAVVLVGDVSGHGPDALESTNSIRSQLHGLLEAGLSPRVAIATVGEHVPVQLAGRFTTVVVAVHDPEAGTLTYAAAGHPPPIIVGPGAEELLSVGASPPIGVGLRTGLRETTVPLPVGSLACFYTDGLVEAKAGGAMIGRRRLTAMVESLGEDDPALTLLERVVADADETFDDMAVCLVRPVSWAHSLASGNGALPPRVEVLELEAEDVETGFAERFLEACRVPEHEVAPAVGLARAATQTGRRALLEVTIASGVGRARVSAAGSETPATAV